MHKETLKVPFELPEAFLRENQVVAVLTGGTEAKFLQLVEELSGLPLQDNAQDESTRTVSAFLAVDDELAVDRNAFADAVLNLNDVLVRRGARVRLRFYDPDKHRELLEILIKI